MLDAELLQVLNQIPAAIEKAFTALRQAQDAAFIERHPGHGSQKVHGNRSESAIQNASSKIEELTHLANNPGSIAGKVKLTVSQHSSRPGNNALQKMDRSVKEAIATTETHRQIKEIQTRIKKFERANQEIPVLQKMIETGESKGKKLPKDQIKELQSMLKERQKTADSFLSEFQG